VAAVLGSLAGLYYAQGRYSEAEPLYERALAIQEKTLGLDHPDVALSLNGLAVLCCVQSMYAEAEPLYDRSLHIREKALDPDHPDVATSLGNLALLFDAQGRYAEAIRFYQASLETLPDQAGVLNNLAWLLATCPDAALRNGREAVRLATRACELSKYTQPLLIGTLAASQAEAGDFQAAIAFIERGVLRGETLPSADPRCLV